MGESLTIRQIGNSSGVVFPKELLDRLGLERGDQLFVSYTPDGIHLSPYDAEFAQQMELARKIMKRDRAILRELAK